MSRQINVLDKSIDPKMVVTGLATGLGNVAVAAHQLANTAESICFMPTFGFSVASTTMISQSVGAGDKDLAKTYARLSIKYGVIIMIFFCYINVYFCTSAYEFIHKRRRGNRTWCFSS